MSPDVQTPETSIHWHRLCASSNAHAQILPVLTAQHSDLHAADRRGAYKRPPGGQNATGSRTGPTGAYPECTSRTCNERRIVTPQRLAGAVKGSRYEPVAQAEGARG